MVYEGEHRAICGWARFVKGIGPAFLMCISCVLGTSHINKTLYSIASRLHEEMNNG